eukprot:CAMPEP_0170607824 /NCGR_PEP_ID=MMETSP0224-20130122/21257_1 /TAXON_ID=285029 /ORGANISM="Togula jolla, Strain CCCM 725" /LENGTH=244 /DNA_ID=CAMNT_0010933009 /DNA_START=43 /DNA_END=777 /DNA_ORIENTATION=-
MAALLLPRIIVMALLGGAVLSEAEPTLTSKESTSPTLMSLYANAEEAANGLGPDNVAIRDALLQGLAYLRATQAALLQHVISTVSVERQRMAARAARAAKGAQPSYVEVAADGTERGLLEKAMTCYFDEGYYSDKLALEIEARKEELFPQLRKLASDDILGDCGLAAKSINKVIHAPHVPHAAERIAHQLLLAVGKTKHRFMMQMAKASGVNLRGRLAEKSIPAIPRAEASPQTPATSLRGVTV